MKNKTPKSTAPGSGDSGVVTQLHNRQKMTPATELASEAELQLLAEQVERLKQHLDELPEVDASRVIQIHNRLQAGDYQVDASRLAEKLLALEATLQDPTPK